jgi:Methyltransferase domain
VASPARRLLPGLRSLGRPQTAGPAPTEPDRIEAALATLSEVAPLELQRRGYHLQRCDYYSALNDLCFLDANRDLWHDRPLPEGIAWDLDGQVALLRRISGHLEELRDVPWDAPADQPAYHWNNDFWRGADALVQYALLRDLKPTRVVEIGCGWSSLLLARALEANASETGGATIVDQIEPYPRRELMAALPEHWTLHESMLQRAPLGLFDALRANDVCFYDGSHVSRTASDVNWFFFEVLPRLAPGVVVHVHDIFWPADYPDEWIFERGQTWNEQYLLQAFLMGNADWEVLIANQALLHARRAELEELFDEIGDSISGVSVWLRRRAATAAARC